jgi:rhamnopyranosyl-N-acetylglucosaminyl-diphospho-decaprenol beta-1,3/1,4-galactofuranosyltransferase
MTRPLRLAAVVVTYNRLDHLRLTLARLLAEPVDHVAVVYNASTDDTAAFLASQTDPRLAVLHLAENSGGAGGFEAGLAAVTQTYDPDWTVLFDDDARPLPGALAQFRLEAGGIDPNLAQNGNQALGVIAAAVQFPDGRICEMNRPSRNPFWHLPVLARVLWGTVAGGARAGFHLMDHELAADAPPVAVDVASFAGFFVSRGAVARGGLPEGGLFIYGDDVIYSLRLRRLAVGIALHPAVRFEHDCASLGVGLVTRPLWKVYYLCRNGVALARAAAGPLLYPLGLLWYCTSWLYRSRYYNFEERPIYRALMYEGIWDGLLGRRGRKGSVHDRVAKEERRVVPPSEASPKEGPVL